MKCEILRTPGLDLVHDLAAKGVAGPLEVPKDLAEGETRDLPDNVAEALIACGVAKAVDKAGAQPTAHAKHEHKHPPAK